MTTQQFIEGHEGRRNKPYKDTAEPPKTTIGVGWNMDANPLPDDIQEYLNANGEITDEMVDRLFSISLDRATVGCKDLFPDFDNFSDNRKMALIDFTFEMGERGESKFTHAVAAINAGQWDDAARYMLESLWAEQVPNRAKDVTDLIAAG